MPRSSVKTNQPIPRELEGLLYNNKELTAFIRAHQPDIVVLQHWILATFLEDALEIPLVVDFHGPLLLEIQFQDNPVLAELKQKKIQAIHKADFFTCAGEKQKHYFQAWLMMAGFDLREEIISVIPVSLSPDMPEHHSQGEPTFVYGGVFLPWQDPFLGLSTLVECLERRGTGELKFFGGRHPVVTVPTQRFEQLQHRLQQSSRVRLQPMIPREQLLREYAQAHVAFDLMQRNAERELAFTTRTVEYLWCGLPVVYNHYAELSTYIQTYQAGWIVDPAYKQAIKAVIEEILDHPERVRERSRNAQQLVRERLTWDRSIEPLDAFCRNPLKREKTALLPAKTHRHRIAMLYKKLRFHLQHEGVQGVLKRARDKLR